MNIDTFIRKYEYNKQTKETWFSIFLMVIGIISLFLWIISLILFDVDLFILTGIILGIIFIFFSYLPEETIKIDDDMRLKYLEEYEYEIECINKEKSIPQRLKKSKSKL